MTIIRFPLLVGTTILVLAVMSWVAFGSSAFLLTHALQSPSEADVALSRLLAAVFAPFVVVALLLPALSARIAGRLLAMQHGLGQRRDGPWPLWVLYPALLGGAELLLGLARTWSGATAAAPLWFHAGLATYAALCAWSLWRRHDDPERTDVDSATT
jgi:hypothetical protein